MRDCIENGNWGSFQSWGTKEKIDKVHTHLAYVGDWKDGIKDFALLAMVIT